MAWEQLGYFWNLSNPCLSDMLVSWPPVPFSYCLGQLCVSLRFLTWRYLLAFSALSVLSAHPLDASFSSELTFLDHIFICSLFHLLLCLCSSTSKQTRISALSPLSLSYNFNTFLLLFVINKRAIFMDRLLIPSLDVWILSDLVSLLSITQRFYYRLWLSTLGQVSEPLCCPHLCWSLGWLLILWSFNWISCWVKPWALV